jgi:transposase InsO family protein
LEIGRFAYLFVLMDLYARYILGWHVASTLAADGALNSLNMALSHLSTTPQNLIHHSDHGVQYTNHAYMNTLLHCNIQPSMGAVGNCYDNIFAERLIGILKSEYCLDTRFMNFSQANLAVKEVIHLYNTDRPHFSLNLAVPQEVYAGTRQDIPPLAIPDEVN